MLSKLHRIPSVRISAIMRTGKRTVQGSLQCTSLSVQGLGTWRCAIVVPTATDKRAVVRNRIRRLVSESIAHVSPELPSGVDMVFFVKKGFIYDSQQSANDQVYALLRSAGFSIQS